MHRFTAGICRIQLELRMRGPWMVRGQPIEEPFVNNRGQPDMREVLWPLCDSAERPLLPASSLKGVLRSTAERILRSMHPERNPDLPPLADNPFVHQQGRVGGEAGEDVRGKLPAHRAEVADSELREWLEQKPKDWFAAHPEYKPLMHLDGERARFAAERAARRIYPLLSPASQLFGCTLHAGLLTLDDAHAPDTTTGRRSHVAIDRFTNGVGEGPFIEELTPGTTVLHTRLTVANFALWHLGLIGLTLQELNSGYAGVGGGTRKGQGQVTIVVRVIEVQYAEQAYSAFAGQSGVISAQALLAGAPWRDLVEDVPAEVLRIEGPQEVMGRPLTLLPELQPIVGGTSNWRTDGLVTLSLDRQQARQLFKEAVRRAWWPYIQLLRGEASNA